MDPQLKAQLGQVIAFAVSSGTANAFGEIQVGSVATAPCRFENRIRSYERPDGTHEVTRLPLLILDASITTPSLDTRFWVPGTSPSSAGFARKPKGIWLAQDENGVGDHWEIML
jgi:hypothetical protein